MKRGMIAGAVAAVVALNVTTRAEDFPKPYGPPCVERENVFEFAEKPAVKMVGQDRYEITFAVRGNCDVTVGIVDSTGVVVRHLGSGVLGANAPAPFRKNSLRQTIYWNGKDDLDVYHKTPEKLKVRVMLGLKPEFDKLLIGMSPKNLPGYVFGVAVGSEGAYVFCHGAHTTVRKFDHDGKYVAALTPPPADMPLEKLSGMCFVEYEKGVRALHGPNLYETTSNFGWVLPGINALDPVEDCQPALLGGRLFYFTGKGVSNGGRFESSPFRLHYLFANSATDVKGMNGVPLSDKSVHVISAYVAGSPDGQWLYLTVARRGQDAGRLVLLRMAADGSGPAQPLVGEDKPGSDNAHFSSPEGVDCDSQGRIYVADMNNNRVQIYSPDGKHLKTLDVDRPKIVRIHQKTGAVYVLHSARVEGKTIGRLTKFAAFDLLKEEFHFDGIVGRVMAVDSWTAKPRLWVGGATLVILEEEGGTLRKIVDFDEDAKKEEGAFYTGRPSGDDTGVSGKVVCDPTREHLYFSNSQVFDLRSGRAAGRVGFHCTDDIAFDKRGFLHCHFNPGFYWPGVGRLDPNRPGWNSRFPMKEVPYDYGVEGHSDGWLGILPVKDQPGAKFFQDGIGVNMRGDVAEQCNIYYVPKMDDVGREAASAGQHTVGERHEADGNNYQAFLQSIERAQKAGEEVYFVRRQPGIPLAGATIWTFDSNGELRQESAAVVGGLINGVQLDEEGRLYFVNNRPRIYGETPFLYGHGGVIGIPDYKGNNRWPFTGTLLKTADKGVKVIMAGAPLPPEPLPSRPPDVMDIAFYDVWSKNQWCWVEGAEWLYAGASPIVQGAACSCRTQRLHVDWYKRTFVPEAYRHSFGVLDTNGNLIMHLGRYGNYDSGNGARSKIPLGGDNIAVFMPRHITGTDNYLVFSDWGERLAVLKLNYYAEETAGISNQ